MKKTLIALGIIMTMVFGTQTTFASCQLHHKHIMKRTHHLSSCPMKRKHYRVSAACPIVTQGCPCTDPCPCRKMITPCPCQRPLPCPCVSPACPILSPCSSCPATPCCPAAPCPSSSCDCCD